VFLLEGRETLVGVTHKEAQPEGLHERQEETGARWERMWHHNQTQMKRDALVSLYLS